MADSGAEPNWRPTQYVPKVITMQPHDENEAPESFDYDQEVSKAHLEAAGWDIGIFQHSNPFLCHLIYVRDYRTNYTSLFSITMKEFAALTPPASPGELSALVARLVKRHQRGRLTRQEDRAFLPAMASYVKGTESYRIWQSREGSDARLHAVINIYPEGGCRLRPFVLRAKGTVIPAEKLIALADEARSMDQKRHPEWFTD